MIQPAFQPTTTIPVNILFQGAQDLLGSENLRNVIDLLPSPVSLDDASHFVDILEARYGLAGGRGIALRIGRIAFQYGIKQFGEQAGFNTVEYRLLPAPRRLEIGLQRIADIVSLHCNDKITILDEGVQWLWRSESSPFCQDRHSADPCCFLTVGFLQAFMSWAGSGRFYRVVETNCQAVGDNCCIFRIDKKPLD
jgi:predicted hydrocarbon binding protein